MVRGHLRVICHIVGIILLSTLALSCGAPASHSAPLRNAASPKLVLAQQPIGGALRLAPGGPVGSIEFTNPAKAPVIWSYTIRIGARSTDSPVGSSLSTLLSLGQNIPIADEATVRVPALGQRSVKIDPGITRGLKPGVYEIYINAQVVPRGVPLEFLTQVVRVS